MARRIFEGLGPGTLIPHRGTLPLNDPRIGPEEGFVLSRIDGHTSLDEVCLLVPFEEQVVMIILRKLWEIGAIDVPGVARVVPQPRPEPPPPKPEPPPSPPSPERGTLSEEQARRIDAFFGALSLQDAFELLEIGRDADMRDIKRAYFKLSKEFHPDRFYGRQMGEYGKKLTAIFQAVKAAFELLSDEKRKAAYLESLR